MINFINIITDDDDLMTEPDDDDGLLPDAVTASSKKIAYHFNIDDSSEEKLSNIRSYKFKTDSHISDRPPADPFS